MTAGFDLSQEMETFARGENFHAQTFLGAHPATKAGYVFRVWAPKAQQIWLVGEFNDWQEDLPMKLGDHGIWSVVAPNAKHGQMYKFKVKQHDGRIVYKIDPFAFRFEERPMMHRSSMTFQNINGMMVYGADVINVRIILNAQ